MQRTHSLASIAVAVALAGASPFALAQAYPGTAAPTQHPQSGAMTHTPPFSSAPLHNKNQTELPAKIPHANNAMGRHDMSGTVQAISAKDIVDVQTDDGVLRVHFPDATKNLKIGEKITLHLAYSVDSPSSSSPPSSP